MSESVSKHTKSIADAYREMGYPYMAQYVETFGEDMNPALSARGPSKAAENFYRRCVEEGRPWDYYASFPRDAVF